MMLFIRFSRLVGCGLPVAGWVKAIPLTSVVPHAGWIGCVTFDAGIEAF